MINNNFAYDYIAMKPFYSHPKLNVLCDLLHIEQESRFTIIRLDSTHIFDKHTIAQLKVFYGNLGGDLTKIASDRFTLINQCVKLAVLFPDAKANGFELELQAQWIDRMKKEGVDVCGYQYQAGSSKPQAIKKAPKSL